MRSNRFVAGTALAAVLALFVCATTDAQNAGGAWGTVKGQVVFAGDKIPAPAPLKVDKDKEACEKNGPLVSQELVVNSKNKGVRWAMVWLSAVDDKGNADPKGKMPIHPALKELKQKEVEIDQPCCMFEPRIVMLREGQTLVAKNSAAIPHNIKIDGDISNNPSLNQAIPPGGKLNVPNWVATKTAAVPMSCTAHGWMNGFIRVFNHPYYTVTDADGNFEIKDAPAGKFRIVLWHEKVGWLASDSAQPDKNGKSIEIKAGGTTDIGKVELKDK
jgi:hypothetical protein